MLHFNNISLPFLSLGLLFVCFVVQFKYVIHYFNTNFTLKTEGVEIARFKAALVAKGITKREGMDGTKIFSLVVKHNSIKSFTYNCSTTKLELEPMDIKITFLLGELEKNMRRKSICNN